MAIDMSIPVANVIYNDEALAILTTSHDHDDRYYTKEEIDAKPSYVLSDTAPENEKALWVDTVNNVIKYYNKDTSSWKSLGAVFG